MEYLKIEGVCTVKMQQTLVDNPTSFMVNRHAQSDRSRGEEGP